MELAGTGSGGLAAQHLSVGISCQTEGLDAAADRRALRQVIETFMRRGGFEMQVNVVSRETLLAAQQHPESYADLLVRVAGYSDYFVKLNAKMQQEIIARTEHTL